MVEITDGDYRAYINNENVFIQHIQYNKILCIEKETINISECESDIIRNLKQPHTQFCKPHAILGIILIENINFIVFVKCAYFIGKIEEAEIFRIKEAELTPLVHFNKIDNISSDVKSQVVGIKNLLTLGFFYSFNYDLTNSTQKLSKLKSMDILSTANKKFFWNYCLYKKFFTPNNNTNKSQSDNILNPVNNLYDNNNFSDFNGNTNDKSKKAFKTKSSKDLINFPNFEDLNLKNFKNVNNPLDNYCSKDNINPKNSINKNNFLNSDDSNIMNKRQNLDGLFGDFSKLNIIKGNHDIDPNKMQYPEFSNLDIINNPQNKFINNNDSISCANNNMNNLINNSPFNQKVNKIWMVVCIYGYVGISNNIVNSLKLHFYLISRRSVYHSGTRYLTRGLDDYGHVANFVETEQIIKIENNLFSFLQFRGSVPIFFEQPGVTAQTQITRTPELTAPAFKKHIDELKEDFDCIYMINLMNVNKPNEHVITQNFENQIKINQIKDVKYLFWDFQNQCKYDNYENLDNFVVNLESIFKIFRYYHENLSTGHKIKEQKGIIRTNCLDCLDRTNVIQARIGWKVLENLLRLVFNNNIPDIFSAGFINTNTNKKHPIIESFKDIWSENGDSISFQYAGTASCITSVTKNGKHGFLGLFQHGLVSITRFYQGNFEDSFKQKCIDTLLQKNIKKSKEDPYNDFFNHNSHISSNSLLSSTNSNPNGNENNTSINHKINNTIIQNSNYFNESPSKIFQNPNKLNNSNSTYKGMYLNLFIGSWNVAGKEFPENHSIIQWLYPKENMQIPDIYVLGFQEICNLNAKNIIVSHNSHKVESWKNIIIKNLNQLGKFSLVKCLDLIGIFIIILIKEELCEYIKNIDTIILRTGLYGTLGNKGSCLIRFEFDNYSFVFCCSHLKAGSSQANSRASEITEILNKSFNLKNSEEINFKDHDFQFIFGDLNFRVDIDLQNCLSFIESGYLETLFLYDQLYTKKSINLDLMELAESPVNFPPTYKYQISTDEYDLKDKRVPSWCDRILFNNTKKIKGLEYNHVEMFRESDHKPIYGIYQIQVKESKNSIDDVNVKINTNINTNVRVNISGNNNNYNNNVNLAPGNNIHNTMGNFYNNQFVDKSFKNNIYNNLNGNIGNENQTNHLDNIINSQVKCIGNMKNYEGMPSSLSNNENMHPQNMIDSSKNFNNQNNYFNKFNNFNNNSNFLQNTNTIQNPNNTMINTIDNNNFNNLFQNQMNFDFFKFQYNPNKNNNNFNQIDNLNNNKNQVNANFFNFLNQSNNNNDTNNILMANSNKNEEMSKINNHTNNNNNGYPVFDDNLNKDKRRLYQNNQNMNNPKN